MPSLIKNYLIVAHKEPQQLARLIGRLSDAHSRFFIHIDKKVALDDFTHAAHADNVVFLSDRVDCVWGDYSIVEATLRLMACALQANNGGYTILLSGQDYPIKSCETIHRYIDANADYNFIDVVTLEDKWPTGYKGQLYANKLNFSSIRGDFLLTRGPGARMLRRWVKLLYFTLKRSISLSEVFSLLFTRRRLELIPNKYVGSAWCAFNYAVLSKAYAFYSAHRDQFHAYFLRAPCPDEMFFQTVLMHLCAADPSIRIKPSFTYVNWVRKGCPLPVTFTADDLSELMDQPEEKLFARKFDANVDTRILDLIDEAVLAQRR